MSTGIWRPGMPTEASSQPWHIKVDHITGAVAVAFDSGVDLMVSKQGTFHLKDAHGNVFQSLPGKIQISSPEIEFYSASSPKFYKLEQEQPKDGLTIDN